MKVYSKLLSAQLDKISSLPSAKAKGMIYYNTSDEKVYVDNSTTLDIIEGVLVDIVIPAGDSAYLKAMLENDTVESIFIPNGTYVLGSDEINLGDSLKKIWGESIDGVVLQSSVTGSWNECIIGNINVDYVEISNLTIEGTVSGTMAGAIRNADADDKFMHLENVRIKGFRIGVYCYDPDRMSISCNKVYVEINNAASPVYGFLDCKKLKNCVVSFASVAETDLTSAGFYRCHQLYNCSVDIGQDGFNATGVTHHRYGFSSCLNMVNCNVYLYKYGGGSEIIETGKIFGFNGCRYITNCQFYHNYTFNSTHANDMYIEGFSSCQSMSNCYVEVAGTHNDDFVIRGFIGGRGISACKVYVTIARAYAQHFGFKGNDGVTASFAEMQNVTQLNFDGNEYCTANSYTSGNANNNTEAAANQFPDN